MNVIMDQVELAKAQGTFTEGVHYASRLDGDAHAVFKTLEDAFESCKKSDSTHTVMTVNMSANSPSNKGLCNMLEKWKLREVIVLSVLAVVFAVVYLVFMQFGNVLYAMFGLIGYDLIFGIWFIVSIIAAYIIRKPGAAFYRKPSLQPLKS